MIAALALLSSCAHTSVTPISRNQIMISTSAAPVCHVSGAQAVAAKMAAVETIRHGFERFVIGGARSANNVRAFQMGPTGSHTTGTFNSFDNTTYGSATTTYTGGGVILTGSNDASLLVTMFNRGEPGYSNAIDARSVLGPEWQEFVEKGVNTCG